MTTYGDYEVETDTTHLVSRREPISILVRLYEIERTDDGTIQTTTRRVIQTWNLPVDEQPRIPLVDQLAQDDADEQAIREQHVAEQREVFRLEHERRTEHTNPKDTP